MTVGTGYGLDGRGFGALFSVRDKNFTFLPIIIMCGSFCDPISFSIEVKRPGYDLATQLHLAPKLGKLGATPALCLASLWSWCLIKCKDFIFCLLNFLFLFADSLWPPIISTATAYSSLHLVSNHMSLSLYCLPFALFLFTTLALFLFVPLKTQIPLCYHLRFEFFGSFTIKSCIYTQLSSHISPYSCNNSENCWMYFNKILFRDRGLPLTNRQE